LGASSKKRIHNAHFRIRIAQPAITAAYLASRLPPPLAGRADGADSRLGITTSLRPAGKRRRDPDGDLGRRSVASSFNALGRRHT
jgi:hypothetical protein